MKSNVPPAAQKARAYCRNLTGSSPCRRFTFGGIAARTTPVWLRLGQDTLTGAHSGMCPRKSWSESNESASVFIAPNRRARAYPGTGPAVGN